MSRKQIPMWAVMALEKKNRYGSIPDLPDEELADPAELERQVFLQEWGPILELPVRGGRSFNPEIDENGGVDCGAFGTVDFERTVPEFDKARYKIDKLREERRDLWMRIDTLRYRVRDANKFIVLRHALRGVIEVNHVLDEDLKGLIRLYLRARTLTDEIERLQEARQKRRQRELAAMLARWE